MLTPADIVKATQIVTDVPVYVLVPRLGPVSFYSQQKRSYNLIAALRLVDKLPPGTTVGVVGAGLAGVTAAAAAHMLGCNVALFETNEAPFHQQHGNHTRFIHPNVIEWPRRGWAESETDLPFLNWSAGSCTTIIDDIEDQWKALGISFKKRHFVHVRDFEHDGAHITASRPYYYEKFRIVIVTVGFGAESTFGLNQRGYWSDEHWHQLLSTHGKVIFVSGTGDGGLIDATCLALLQFDQGEVLRKVMTFPPLLEIAEKLIRTDEEARSILTAAPTVQTRAEASQLLYRRYNELQVAARLPDLKVRENYKKIILNSALPTPLSINASIVNRVIVHGLVARGAIDYVRGELCRFPENRFQRQLRLRAEDDDELIMDDIDEVIIRHGPEGALRSVLGKKAAFPPHSEQVDQLGREEHWREVEFKTPNDFTPSSKIAIGRAGRYREEFEAYLQAIGVEYQANKIGVDRIGGNVAFYVEVDDANRSKLEEHPQSYHRIRIVATQQALQVKPRRRKPPTERLRPLTLGAGITSDSGGSGTLGCFVKTSDGRFALVTAGHVLGVVFPPGGLYQPSRVVESKKKVGSEIDDLNLVATVEKVLRRHDDTANRFDIGYGILAPTVEFIPCFSPILQLPIPRRLAPDDYEVLGEQVWIVGYTTPLRGVVEAVEVTNLKVSFGGTHFEFEGLFEVNGVWDPTALAGVSGALVMALDGTVLGMVFAGGGQDAEGFTHLFAFPLGPALSKLECEAIFLT